MRSCLLYPLSPHTVLARLQDSPPPRIIPTFADPRCLSNIRILFAAKEVKLGERVKVGCSPRAVESSSMLTGADEDEDGVCPVDCVREFKTDEEFTRFLEKGKESSSLVVVDFYKTSCGSCKYIEQGFRKLCKGSGGEELPVVFLKHNVIDEYDEESEVAERLRIRAVPLFHFYKDGVLVESFATRDKERILAAISKYTSPA